MTRRFHTTTMGFVAAAMAVAVLGVAGCQEAARDGGEERPRVGMPGVYLGEPDQKLTAEQRRRLQERTGLQH